MPISWKDLIKDEARFPGTLVVEIAGEKMTLADLRNLDKSDRDALVAEQKKIEAERAQLAKDIALVQQAQQNVASMFANLQNEGNSGDGGRGNEPPKGNPAVDEVIAKLESDPLLGPVIKLVKQQAAAIEALQGKDGPLAKIMEAQKQLAKTGIRWQLQNTFDLLPDKPTDLTLEALVRKAGELKHIDPDTGVPDLRKTFNEMRAPDQRKSELDKAVQAALDKQASDLAVKTGLPVADLLAGKVKPEAVLPKPSGTGFSVTTDEKPDFADLDAAMAAAAKDPEIAKLAAGGFSL